MNYKSFFKFYFKYVLFFDYFIYKNLKRNNYQLNFLVTLQYLPNFKASITKQKLVITHLQLIFLFQQLFHLDLIKFLTTNLINLEHHNFKIDFNEKRYIFFDNIFIFYYKFFFIKLFNVFLNQNYYIKLDLIELSFMENFINENYLFNFLNNYEIFKKFNLNFIFNKLV